MLPASFQYTIDARLTCGTSECEPRGVGSWSELLREKLDFGVVRAAAD